MRNASIGDRVWDSSNSNNWKRPADLNTYLNGSYLTITLNQAAQSQIVDKDWNIGAVTYNNNDLDGQITAENSSKWNGKVALITASEYIRSNSNQSSCGTLSQNNGNYSTCTNSSWMYINDYWWTLSPSAGYSSMVFGVRSNGSINTPTDYRDVYAVRPSVYLSSEVQIIQGDGSYENPYQIV